MKLFRRISSMAIVTAHAFGAIVWMIFTPGGFAIDHSRIWTNRVGPIAVLVLAIAVIFARVSNRPRLLQHLVLIFPLAWIGAAISGIITFPISARLILPIALIGAAIMIFSIKPWPGRSWRLGAIAIASLAIGAVFPPLERATDPRTRPVESQISPPSSEAMLIGYAPGTQLRNDVGVHPGSGQISVNHGRIQVQIAPLLTFISRSPDRCWTIFASRDARRGPARKLVALDRPDPQSLRAWYSDDDASTLSIDTSVPNRVEIDAQSRLPKSVFSHLNSYAEIAIVGHRKLRLGFSPCDETKIDVRYADYPFGAPIRFAYFDAGANRLRIVEATNAEKGPFHELASGPLVRGQPLVITLFDDETRMCSITLHDWSAQASDEISPTAGWGVPANSIAFSLSDRNDRSPATILGSLADTGIGRGYDSVGHAAGVYRNRMTIESSIERDAASRATEQR